MVLASLTNLINCSVDHVSILPMETSSHADSILDLGEKGCGQLVMEVMLAMRNLAEGQTLLITAYDLAANEDLAAWCRMTGNTLVKILPDPAGKQFLLRKGRS